MIQRLIFSMVDYYAGDPKRIQHFLKVHSFAKLIGMQEGLDGTVLQTLEAAAVVHDIGIKPAEKSFIVLPENIRSKRVCNRHMIC